MEDSSRDLEKELKKYSVPNPFKRKGKWQMLFVSEDGKMVSIKRYKELMMTLVVIFSLSLISAALFSMLYYKSVDKIRDLRVALTQAEKERNQLQEDKEHLQAQLFIPKKKMETVESVVKTEKAIEEPPKEPAKKVVPKVEKMTADIKDLTFTKDERDGETRIRFIVKNTSELATISGRVFVIMMPDENNSQSWLTMPPVSLKDGIPSTPSRGQFFSINHFKSVKFKFNNPFSDDHYKKMGVYIFSTEGEKVYENTFDVDLDIIEKPDADPVDENPEVKTEQTTEAPQPNVSVKKPETHMTAAIPASQENVRVEAEDRTLPNENEPPLTDNQGGKPHED